MIGKRTAAIAFLLSIPCLAEDPYLGRIKAIKCMGCEPGWVQIVVHDPLDMRDFEIKVKVTDYNKVVSPLPGKQAPPPATKPADSLAQSTIPGGNPGSDDSIFIPPPALADSGGPPPVPSRCLPYVRVTQGGGK